MRSKLFKLSEQSEGDIATIMQRYACETETQAVRLALRVLAQSERLDIVLPATPKHGRRTVSNIEENHAASHPDDLDRHDPAPEPRRAD